jgi:putative tryptophan/tyrosine transport system substrate-binding protein
VIFTWTSGGARAAAAATDKIPIVVAPVNDGTMAALVSDFAHPAGNVTGMTLNNRQQHEKCLQLLKEAAPGITRVGVLLNPLNRSGRPIRRCLPRPHKLSVSPWFGWRRAARQSSIRHSRR